MAPATKKGHIDLETGFWTDEPSEAPIRFLPDEPGESPPYELILTDRDPDGPTSDDPVRQGRHGHKHILIGGDEAVVADIIKFYEGKGKKVPAGYAQAAKDHAAAVEKAAQESQQQASA